MFLSELSPCEVLVFFASESASLLGMKVNGMPFSFFR